MQIVNIKVFWSYGRFEQYDDSTGTHWRINGSGAGNQNDVLILIIIIINIDLEIKIFQNKVLMLIIINIENINNAMLGERCIADLHCMIDTQ